MQGWLGLLLDYDRSSRLVEDLDLDGRWLVMVHWDYVLVCGRHGRRNCCGLGRRMISRLTGKMVLVDHHLVYALGNEGVG